MMASMELAIAAAVMIAIGLMVFSSRIRQILESLNNWRGGPPPTHPVPANDGVLVLRRRARSSHSSL